MCQIPQNHQNGLKIMLGFFHHRSFYLLLVFDPLGCMFAKPFSTATGDVLLKNLQAEILIFT